MSKCYDFTLRFVDRWAAREEDTALQTITKRCCTIALALAFLLDLLGSTGRSNSSSLARVWVYYSSMLVFACELVYLRIRRRAPVAFLVFMSAAFTASLLMVDFVDSVETTHRVWPIVVVIVDVLLVIRAPAALSTGVVATLCVYFVFVQIEATWRFGLFDLAIFAPHEDRQCHGDCDKPPCAEKIEASLAILVSNFSVVLLDFYFTRGFALQMQREKEKIASAVTAAQAVATSLALFDLDAADQALSQNQADMPPDLCDSLCTILNHLRAYKPFLPQSVLAIATGARHSVDSLLSESPASSLQSTSLADHQPVLSIAQRRLSLLHVCATLPAVTEWQYTSAQSEMLAAVLKSAAPCKGVVDHFCGDVVCLSYNASLACPRHTILAVQTAEELCVSEKGPGLRGGVCTGYAFVGPLGVPDLQRHCIVGTLDAVCQSVMKATDILGHRLLCLHATAVDVAFVQKTRIVLDRLRVCEVRRNDDVDETSNFTDSGCVAYEVLGPCDSAPHSNERKGGAEWMYELEAQGTSEWDSYNRAGLVLHRSGDLEEALRVLQAGGANAEETAQLAEQFSEAASRSRVVDFRPTFH